MNATLPPIAILAGGLATRLGSLTASQPKSLVPVAGEPFIAHQLRLLRRQGVSKVVLCIGHLGHRIRDFVQDGSTFGLDVQYSEDGKRLLGTGGALRRALPLLSSEFFVMYGDSYLDVPFEPVLARLRESRAAAVMVVFRNDNRWERSNVELSDNWVRQYDKRNVDGRMSHVDFGLTLMQADTLLQWPDEAFDLADVLTDLSVRGALAALEVTERFYEIGSTDGLAETERRLQRTTR